MLTQFLVKKAWKQVKRNILHRYSKYYCNNCQDVKFPRTTENDAGELFSLPSPHTLFRILADGDGEKESSSFKFFFKTMLFGKALEKNCLLHIL